MLAIKTRTNEQIARYRRIYYEKNRQKICEKQRLYYAKNKEREQIKHRTRRKQNFEKFRRAQRDRHIKNPLKRMLYSAKARAKKLNLPFELTTHDLIIPEFCPVLGVLLLCSNKYGSNYSPSLDRMDSSKGYTKENVKIISWRANRLKQDATIDELECVLAYMRGR